MSKLTWNNATGRYEGEFDGQQIAVSGDVMSESKNDYAREMFGADYADLDDAATDKVDAETEAAYLWMGND